MNTDQDFVARLLADPADDTARLVYADWLEEQGEALCGTLRRTVEERSWGRWRFDLFVSESGKGDIVRIDQAELDAARINNTPSLLPAAIEANFMRLIEAGLLSPDWGPCGRSYQDRLAVGDQPQPQLPAQPAWQVGQQGQEDQPTPGREAVLRVHQAERHCRAQ